MQSWHMMGFTGAHPILRAPARQPAGRPAICATLSTSFKSAFLSSRRVDARIVQSGLASAAMIDRLSQGCASNRETRCDVEQSTKPGRRSDLGRIIDAGADFAGRRLGGGRRLLHDGRHAGRMRGPAGGGRWRTGQGRRCGRRCRCTRCGRPRRYADEPRWSSQPRWPPLGCQAVRRQCRRRNGNLSARNPLPQRTARLHQPRG